MPPLLLLLLMLLLLLRRGCQVVPIQQGFQVVCQALRNRAVHNRAVRNRVEKQRGHGAAQLRARRPALTLACHIQMSLLTLLTLLMLLMLACHTQMTLLTLLMLACHGQSRQRVRLIPGLPTLAALAALAVLGNRDKGGTREVVGNRDNAATRCGIMCRMICEKVHPQRQVLRRQTHHL